MRQMKLIGFMQAQNCSNYPASWRHRLSQENFGSREYYEGIGRTLEAGKFAPQSTARRSSHPPCPDCGSRMIRSRDLREMCVVCGYLQTHA